MDEKGFSLIEILIAIVLLTLVIFPFMDVVTISTKATIDSKKRFKASNYAKELLEEIKLKKFDEKDSKSDSPNSGDWSEIGSDTGEDENNGRNNDWDDIDDYYEYTEEGSGIKGLEGNIYDEKFYRKVEVKYVEDDSLEDTVGKSNTKKVIVECYSIDKKEKYIEIIWYSKKSK